MVVVWHRVESGPRVQWALLGSGSSDVSCCPACRRWEFVKGAFAERCLCCAGPQAQIMGCAECQVPGT